MTMQDFLQRMLEHMGIEEATVQVDATDELTQVHIQVSEEDSGLLIGYHGETLAAIQKVVQISYSTPDKPLKVSVNVNDYKERRKIQLEENAHRAAMRVLESGRSYQFGYLPANERLIIHQYISENPELSKLKSASTGDGANRRLEITLKQD